MPSRSALEKVAERPAAHRPGLDDHAVEGGVGVDDRAALVAGAQDDDAGVRSVHGHRLHADAVEELAVLGGLPDGAMPQQAAVGLAATNTRIVHPGATAFPGAGIHVQIESRTDTAIIIHQFVEAHILVPGIHVFSLFELNAEQLANYRKHAIDNRVRREPGAHLFFGNIVACFTQTFAPETDIPGV